MGLTHDSVTSGCNFGSDSCFRSFPISTVRVGHIFWNDDVIQERFFEKKETSTCRQSTSRNVNGHKKERFVISNPSSYHHHHESFCWIVPFDGCCHVWHGSCRLLLLLFTTEIEQSFYGPVVPRSHHR